MTYWLSCKEYTIGIIVSENGIVINAPPIAKWTIGKLINEVLDYYLSKNFVIKII